MTGPLPEIRNKTRAREEDSKFYSVNNEFGITLRYPEKDVKELIL